MATAENFDEQGKPVPQAVPVGRHHRSAAVAKSPSAADMQGSEEAPR
jgi:hypothetical protein